MPRHHRGRIYRRTRQNLCNNKDVRKKPNDLHLRFWPLWWYCLHNCTWSCTVVPFPRNFDWYIFSNMLMLVLHKKYLLGRGFWEKAIFMKDTQLHWVAICAETDVNLWYLQRNINFSYHRQFLQGFLCGRFYIDIHVVYFCCIILCNCDNIVFVPEIKRCIVLKSSLLSVRCYISTDMTSCLVRCDSWMYDWVDVDEPVMTKLAATV